MEQKYKTVHVGCVKPTGWIYEQMKDDLTKGFVGHLDKIVPHLIEEDDIYGENRLTKKVKAKDVGAIAQDADWEVQYLWWNSETQSNWWDGFVRHALLIEDEESIKKVRAYIDRMLSYQDEDGYLGIYDKDLRFQFEGENGELWAQSSLFRVLLAYYEGTKEDSVLKAVQRAVDVMMKAYPIYQSTPFKVKDSYAGLCHGLTITDTLERLTYLTGDIKYVEYAAWLYEDYSKHEVSEDDIQLLNLLDEKYRFKGHGVHTYEHLRALTIAYYTTENETLKRALEGYLEKLETVLTPSGGPIGDEWVAENIAHATETGYEYCSIHELLHSYTLLLEKTGEMKWADRIEWLLFNAGQGARHPHESGIAYLKTDNSYAMEGVFQQEQPHCTHDIQTRYKYSPSHQDAAVCCVPNAGRIYPYYVQSMWMEDEKGVVASLYGPSQLKTVVNEVQITITQKTNYPFENEIACEITAKETVSFQLTLRKPSWVEGMKVTIDGAHVTELEDKILIQKEWCGTECITITFHQELKQHNDFQGATYMSYGPFVLALPLEGEEEIVKEFEVNGFKDIHYKPAKEIPTGTLPRSLVNFIVERKSNEDWKNHLEVKGYLLNEQSGEKVEATFVPMGGTILRKVTF